MKVERIENLLKSDAISNWERGFCESVASQLQRGRTLSVKQVNIIHKIEANAASHVVGYEQWVKQWDAEKKAIWDIALDYYENNPPYFANEVAKRKLSKEKGEEHIPSRKAFKKITENKYVQKVINELEKQPAFIPGSMVALRANTGAGDILKLVADTWFSVKYNELRELRTLPLFIVNVLDTVGAAAKGAREYTVLPAGWTKTLKVQERHIKKAK